MSKQMSMNLFYEKVFPNKPLIVDVREQSEFTTGHIPGAVNIPIKEIMVKLDSIDPEQTYYFVGHSDHRSEVATAFLASQEFDVVELLGGMKAWPGELAK